MNTLMELFLTFAKIGTFTFGGGYAMISLINHECVEKRQWITPDELTDITVIAESTPGPIAINCATYTGYKKAGFTGALAATFGMILPSFIIILLISVLFQKWMQYQAVINAFRGIRIAVALLIIMAAVTMMKKMLMKAKNKKVGILLAATFACTVLALNILNIHFSTIYLIIIAGIIGLCIYGLPKKAGGKS